MGTRTYYAEWKGVIYNFAYKRDRDYFLDHAYSSKYISSKQAYSGDYNIDFIQVPASCQLGANEERKRRIKEWYENK